MTHSSFKPSWRFRICRCEGECGCITEDAATAAAARRLREKFQWLRCDHEAVSCCTRCNVMYLVHVAERLGEGVFRYVEGDLAMTHIPDSPFGCLVDWGVASPSPLLPRGAQDMRRHVCNLAPDHDGGHMCKCGDERGGD